MTYLCTCVLFIGNVSIRRIIRHSVAVGHFIHELFVDFERLIGMLFSVIANRVEFVGANTSSSLSGVWVHTTAVALEFTFFADKYFYAQAGKAECHDDEHY